MLAISTLPTRVDPVTFEILRHRLWSINEEAGHTLERVSGSLIASEVHDMNTSIMNAQGDSLVLAPYMLVHAISMETLAKDVVGNYRDNPGINLDDMFLSNDPYVGAQHQMDVVVLGAIHWEGELIGWVGSTIHQIDIGGPVPGQVQVGAKDIYGEQPLFPPFKIVEGGVLRSDLVRLYLRMSRVAEIVRLDLTAMIAANNVAKARVQELCRQYGVETVKALMLDLLDHSEERMRSRLRELPDGTWRHRSYLEYEMANWVGSLTTEELFGTDQRGQWFGATMLDTYFGGGGARSRKDGVDTGGYVGSIYELAPNAEAYEFQYPILYLFRRHQADSGGGGMFRRAPGGTLSDIGHATPRVP